eukprot:Em0015g1043a
MSISKLVSQGSGKAATIAMSVVVDMDMQWCIHTLHRPLHVPMCSLLSGMPILLNSVDSVFKILNFLDNTKFCAGNPDKVLVFGTSKCFLYMVVQPHAAYSAFTHGLVHKWSYLARTVPDITRLFQPLEDVIRTKFITGRAPPNDLGCNLLSLPPKLGGLGIPEPTTTSDTEYTASRSVCKPLYNLILLHDSSYPTEAIEQQVEAKKEVHSLKLKHSQGSAFNLRPQLANSTQRSMDLAQEKGASNWLTTLPIDENGFTLHKGAFRDAIALRYGWLPSNIPSTCTCGKSFTVEHALSCPLGGFPSIRHNEIRDLTANLMTEGETFPAMTANTEDGARSDINCS